MCVISSNIPDGVLLILGEYSFLIVTQTCGQVQRLSITCPHVNPH